MPVATSGSDAPSSHPIRASLHPETIGHNELATTAGKAYFAGTLILEDNPPRVKGLSAQSGTFRTPSHYLIPMIDQLNELGIPWDAKAGIGIMEFSTKKPLLKPNST